MENTQTNLVGMNQNYLSEEELLSVQSVAAFTHIMVDIIDDRIRKRLSQEDILKAYNAEITNYTTASEEVSSITVTYDNDFSVTISNSSVKQIPVDYLSGTIKKSVKICTYDGVQFYVLHTL